MNIYFEYHSDILKTSTAPEVGYYMDVKFMYKKNTAVEVESLKICHF